MARVFERDGTRTFRRNARQTVRRALGVSNDAAPNAEQALRAATALASILDDASGGVYKLRVVSQYRTIDGTPLGEPVSCSAALADLRQADSSPRL